jgi:pyruvate dehydrogenase E2 component (dihydrolipoamide acetyltransferase)
MAREFELPDVGEGVAEGEIVSWLVEPGEDVSEDQPVAEVETDKAVVEVPSPVNGSVQELHAEAGAVVPVGEVIVTFAVDGEDSGNETEEVGAPEGGALGTGTTEETRGATENETRGDDAIAAGDGEATEATAGTDASAADATDDGARPGSSEAGGGRVFAAPSARRAARELGVDIGSVEGSGPAGRVSEGDVRAAAGNGQGSPTVSESADGSEPADERESAGGEAEPESEPEAETERIVSEAESTPEGIEADSGASKEAASSERTSSEAGTATAAASVEAADRDRTLAAPATRRVARELDVDLDRVPATEQRNGEAFVSSEAVEGYAEAQQEAQRADAETVSASSTDAGSEAEAEAEGEKRGERVPYQGIRRTIGQAMERSAYTAPHVTHHDSVDASALVETRERLKPIAAERGISLTYMPLIMTACVAALREFPFLNSSLDEDAGEIVLKEEYDLGVAVGTDAGLMVPVVEGVDRKGMLQIASETNELIEKARDRSISREEMQGGTFTVTNFGAVGGEYATPLINYPETAILGLGAIEERPVAIEGEVVARPTLPLSLSVDHRVIDGATAAQFANRVGEYLEEPRLLLLD